MIDYENFESLSPEEQARIFHQTSFKERGELLLRSHNPMALTRSLSHEELYLLVKEMDMEERSEAIKYASREQMVFISDMEVWKKDQIIPEQFIRWLETLERAGYGKLLEWMLEADYETVVTGLQKIIQVQKPDHEWTTDEVLGDIPYFTLDFMYYFYVREENLETVKHAMEILFENHRGRYTAIVEGIMAELDNELEDEAYHRREIRLSERGFPDPETAHKIYRPISEKEFLEFPKKDNAGVPSSENAEEPKLSIPNYLVLFQSEPLFMDQVIQVISAHDSKLTASIQEEMVWLSNKVLASQGTDISSEDKVRAGFLRAKAMVSIGLELLSGGDLAKACKIVEERWLEIIFRRTMTELYEVREKAVDVVRHYWNSDRVKLIQFLCFPYDLILKGLLQTVPQFYDASKKVETDPIRDFRRPDEINRASAACDQMEAIHRLLKGKTPEIFALSELANPEQTWNMFNAITTAFAHFVLDGKIRIKRIGWNDLQSFMDKGWEGVSPRRIKANLKKDFFEAFIPSKEKELLGNVLTLAFQELEDEFKDLDIKRIEPRFISSILVSASEPKKKIPARGPESSSPKRKAR